MKSRVHVETSVEIRILKVYRNRTVLVQDPDGRHLIVSEGDTLIVRADFEQNLGS